MNQKDVWLLGFFTLAYLYLDSRPMPVHPGAPRDLPRASREPRMPVQAPERVVPRDACPRDLTHRVSLRADGAMWCLGCDEGFYPKLSIWDAMMGEVAA